MLIHADPQQLLSLSADEQQKTHGIALAPAVMDVPLQGLFNWWKRVHSQALAAFQYVQSQDQNHL